MYFCIMFCPNWGERMVRAEDIKVGSVWWEKRKDKYLWRMRFYNPNIHKDDRVGVALNSKTSQAKTEARTLLLRKAKLKIEGTFNSVDLKVNLHILTFKQVVVYWLRDCENRVKPSTFLGRKKVVRGFLRKFGEQEIVDITVFQIQMYFNNLDIRKTTLTTYFQIFKQIFDFAVRMEILTENPVEKVKLVVPKKTIEDFERKERKFFSLNDIETVLKEMRKSSNSQTWRIAKILEFLFLSGLRYCEMSALKYENYDCLTKTVFVKTDLDYSEGVLKRRHVTVKTPDSYRSVTLNERASILVEQCIQENKDNISNSFVDYGYIFCSRTGNPYSISGINRSFRYYGSKTGLNKQFSCHCMRHSHISLLLENGVPQKAVMQRVGHASVSITNEIYAHVTPKMENNIIEVLNSVMLKK